MKMFYWLVSICCVASTAPALTLEECLQIARRDNPELRAAHARINAAAGRAVQARLWPNPELELSAEDMPADNPGLSDSVNWAGVSQTVPFPGKKRLDGQIGDQARRVREWEAALRERALVRDVTGAFYRVLALEQKQRVTAELQTLAQSLADAARQRVAAGAAGDQEQLRAEIEADRAALESTAARRDLAEARQMLAAWLGRPREPLGALTGELRPTIPLPVSDGPLDPHPQLRAAAAQRERAALEIRRARLEPLPDVTVGAEYGRDTAANESLLKFRVSLPLPLFDRGQGRQREARAEAEIATQESNAAEQKLTEQLALARARMAAAQEQVDAYRARILPKATEALRLVRGGFEAGKFGFLDLVDTQRTAAEAQLAYLDQLLELNLAHADYAAWATTAPQE